MKAGVVYGQGDLRYEEVEKPVPLTGQVLIKVKYTGMIFQTHPNVLGHEFIKIQWKE
jgi:threonine dehydrogenase-like Zn-dependent dehydrogenase